MEAQEQAQETQGVTPLTKVEKVRIIRILQYNLLRSFVESSLKDTYQWRLAYEYPDKIEWVKEGKWVLEVYKNSRPTGFEKLPVKGIYKIDTTNNISPFATLKSLRNEVWFVLIGGEVGMLYDKIPLVFTEDAPIAFAPKVPVPFARPIPVYEIINTLNHYVSI